MFRSLVVLSLVLLPCLASAQIVNVQSLAGKPVDPGLSGNATLALDWQAGNTQILAGSAAVTNFYRMDANLLLLTVSGAYGVKGTPDGAWAEEPYQQKIFEHLRFRHTLSPAWSLEAFGQHEYDRWRRLKFRALGGVGGRWDSDPWDGAHVGVGLAYMAQWEELLKPKPGDLTGVHLEHRASSYVTGALELTKAAAASLTTYLQPRLDDPADLRGLVEASLTVALTKRLQLKATYGLGYDLRPPQGVRGYDATTKVALGATW